MSSTPSRSAKQSRSSASEETTQPPAQPMADASASSEPGQDDEVKLVRPVRPSAPVKPPASTPASSPPAAIVAVVSKGSKYTPAQASSEPAIPVSSEPLATSSIVTDPEVDDGAMQSIIRQQPIPPPSERMQYRAIGLIRGRYTASAEQLTRGNLVTPDGTTIDAVLLGRVISLVKKHIDLEEDHLWVVYPRTREKEDDLHAQIVGVWEPEKLHKFQSDDSTSDGDGSDEDGEQGNKISESVSDSASESAQQEESTPVNLPQFVPSSELTDGYFSIRGEVIYHSEENQRLIVKIRQTPRKTDTRVDKAFKLLLRGTIASEKVLGRFWDLHVQRNADHLVIQSASPVGIIMPKKSAGGGRSRPPRGGGGGRKPWQGTRPNRGDTPAPGKPATPAVRREPSPKPMKRRDKDAAP